MTRAYVGIGANLGDARASVESAFTALASLPRTRLAARSSLYRTAPVGVEPQPDYVNAVAGVDTGLAPRALLETLHAIEARHGRERPHPGAARTLDLDLLVYGAERSDDARLALPHPRLHLRRFVLEPLAELDAALEIPGRGRVGALLEACRDQRVERMA